MIPDDQHKLKRAQSAKYVGEASKDSSPKTKSLIPQIEKTPEQEDEIDKEPCQKSADAESSDECDIEQMRQALQAQGMTLDRNNLDMIIEKYGNNLKKNQRKAKPEDKKKVPPPKEPLLRKKPGVKEIVQSATAKQKKSLSTNQANQVPVQAAVINNKREENLSLSNQKRRLNKNSPGPNPMSATVARKGPLQLNPTVPC